MDFSVIASNWKFLLLQGLVGFGPFIGGTLRLAIPAILLGFALGIFVGLARLSSTRWVRAPATVYVEFFRGVPLVMVIFWIWFIIPQLLRLPIPNTALPSRRSSSSRPPSSAGSCAAASQ